MSHPRRPSQSAAARREAFVWEYLKDFNATQAAIRAGYSKRSAKQQGARLLSDENLQAELSRAKAERTERRKIEADQALEELTLLTESDIADLFDEHGELLPVKQMPARIRRCISGIDVEKLFEWQRPEDGKGPAEKVHVGNIVKIRLWSKTQAIELVQRHLGVAQRHEHTGKGGGPIQVRSDLAAMPKERLEQLLALLTAPVEPAP